MLDQKELFIAVLKQSRFEIRNLLNSSFIKNDDHSMISHSIDHVNHFMDSASYMFSDEYLDNRVFAIKRVLSIGPSHTDELVTYLNRLLLFIDSFITDTERQLIPLYHQTEIF